MPAKKNNPSPRRRSRTVPVKALMDQLAEFFDEASKEEEDEEDALEISPHEYASEPESSTEEGEISDTASEEQPTIFVSVNNGDEVKERYGQLACTLCYKPLDTADTVDAHMSSHEDVEVWSSFCVGSCIPSNLIIEQRVDREVFCSFCGETRTASDLIPRYNPHFEGWYLACKKTCPHMYQE